MQAFTQKIFIFFLGYLLSGLCTVRAADPKAILLSADSLFEQKRYTEALSQYEEALSGGLYSPRMLLRMVYITENAGSYAEALYYLNLLYYRQADRRLWLKMSELAAEHQLAGYEQQDLEYLSVLYQQYKYWLLWPLWIGGGLLLWLAFRLKSQQRGYMAPLWLLMVGLAVHFYLHHAAFRQDRGILVAEAYIMDGPSAAARLIGKASPGHRVTLGASQDIWQQIEWEGRSAFVRTHHLRRLSLN